MHNNMMNTDERIKEARQKAGLSQKGPSKVLETRAVYICRGSISRIESGERTVTDIEISTISKALNITFDYLFGQRWILP